MTESPPPAAAPEPLEASLTHADDRLLLSHWLPPQEGIAPRVRIGRLHGAPLRLRCENELGFKMVKWVAAIEFLDDFTHLGAGQGGYNEDHEFYGYRMPI